MSRAARLAELRALRSSKKGRLSTYEVEEDQSLYEEVDEEGYKKVVRDRLDRDDFVVDDNGEGYADDGREEWMGERRDVSASGSEEEDPLRGKAGTYLFTFFQRNGLTFTEAKRKREEDREKTVKTNHSINRYFSNGTIASAPKPKVPKFGNSAVFETDFGHSLSPLSKTLHLWQTCWAKSIPISHAVYLPRR